MICGTVTNFISGEFLLPKFPIVCRHAAMNRASMPEASVNEDRDALRTKSKVWLSWQRQMSPPASYFVLPQYFD